MPGPAARPCLGAAKSTRSGGRPKSAKLYPGKASRPLVNAVAERLNACLRFGGRGRKRLSAFTSGTVGASGLAPAPAPPNCGTGRGPVFGSAIELSFIVCVLGRQIVLDALRCTRRVTARMRRLLFIATLPGQRRAGRLHGVVYRGQRRGDRQELRRKRCLVFFGVDHNQAVRPEFDSADRKAGACYGKNRALHVISPECAIF